MTFFSIEGIGIETKEMLDADSIREEVEHTLDEGGFYNIDVLDVYEDPELGGWRVDVDLDHDGYAPYEYEGMQGHLCQSLEASEVIMVASDEMRIMPED